MKCTIGDLQYAPDSGKEIGLWNWESDLARLLRLSLVAVAGVGCTIAMFPRSGGKSQPASEG